MTLGVIMLVHTGFDRAEQMVRHWSDAGCPVVVHVDSNVPAASYNTFSAALADLADVRFCARHRCEWGTWGMVAASQEAATLLLEEFPDAQHVYLASGSCLPLRPVAELRAYLDAHPDTDFIESATTADVPWTVGGLDRERFTLRFPFAWKKHRRLFDQFVKLQQLIGYRRTIPEGIVPHMGSQWWCLTRQTLDAILQDPKRGVYDRYFRQVWIPDESYYQTLTRLHARQVESRSLTLAKFDYQGKPHIFFNDHLELLQRSKSFVARKIWHNADLLYQTFPLPHDAARAAEEPNSGAVDRVFSHAVDRRTRGRPGLYMQSRFPSVDRQNGIAAAPYAVLQGLDDVFPDFQAWLTKQTGAQVHGHLFAKDRAHFADESEIYRGGLSDNARLRDYNGKMFLANLIWNGRDDHHCFQFGPADTQKVRWTLAKDTNASIWVVSGAWSIPLFASGRSASDVRAEAARLQRIEDKFLKVLRAPDAHARIKIMTLADFIEAPMDVLQAIIDDIAGHRGNALKEVPKMPDLTGLPDFLQDLKNQGMHPFLTGDITIGNTRPANGEPRRKPYVISAE
ncbi:beta-1,6-N-acetylglucosaminyltransferase [Yoonia sp. F2084L]|uniref:beta-1,6-N-acetylglucosaminyltransferase n=1 Tax=Yoonia sp. F2084L TaxID=2926419 RepID=UPI001FF17FCB|nr:beta-1,6-N-acetylglucosaminyltransferase [Yoonia sp. F2084L]MCK0097524.1 beta-1,6-N-acetylglucosaminyltransferase [Yoonia sp. F2084L]